MKREPKTVAEVLSCEEYQPYDVEEIVIQHEDVERGYVEYDGRAIKIRGRMGDVVHIPKPKKCTVRPTRSDSILCVRDEHGQLWQPVLDGDVWKRTRFIL